MRTVFALAAVAVLATVPFASHSQTGPSGAPHHPDKSQAVPASPGGMDMKGGAASGMMGGDMSRMMAMMHGSMMGGSMMGSGMMGDMQLKHVEGRLAFLKTELKITPAQEPQWTKFADGVRSAAKSAQATKPPMMQGGTKAATAPERLAHYEKTLAARLETVGALKAAVDPLYASFSDEQKKLADELLIGPMGIM